MNRHILMKKSNLSNRSRIYFFIFVITIRVLLTFLEQYYDYYLIGKQTKSIFYLGIIFLAIRIIKPTHKIVKIIFYTFIGFLCISIGIIMLLDSGANQFYYDSPNKETKIIIDENSFLFASLIDVYEKKYFIFKRKINTAHIGTDDGYRPFSDGAFRLNWIDEREVIIEYKFRYNEDIWKSTHINLD